MEELSLGIGSRVEHPEFGKGVVIQVYDDNYEITFIDFGVKSIARTFDKLKVLDYRGSDDDLLSFSDVRKVLKKLLQRKKSKQNPIKTQLKKKRSLIKSLRNQRKNHLPGKKKRKLKRNRNLHQNPKLSSLKFQTLVMALIKVQSLQYM